MLGRKWSHQPEAEEAGCAEGEVTAMSHMPGQRLMEIHLFKI